MFQSLCRNWMRLFRRANPVPNRPPVTLHERLEALAEGVVLICRSRLVERLRGEFIIRDSRTRREFRLRDLRRIVRLLQR